MCARSVFIEYKNLKSEGVGAFEDARDEESQQGEHILYSMGNSTQSGHPCMR